MLQGRRNWEAGGHLHLPYQILAAQLTLLQPGRANYAHHITTCPSPGFSNLPPALCCVLFLPLAPFNCT